MEFDRLVDFAKKEKIDLTIIGMDDPLVGAVSYTHLLTVTTGIVTGVIMIVHGAKLLSCRKNILL